MCCKDSGIGLQEVRWFGRVSVRVGLWLGWAPVSSRVVSLLHTHIIYAHIQCTCMIPTLQIFTPVDTNTRQPFFLRDFTSCDHCVIMGV